MLKEEKVRFLENEGGIKRAKLNSVSVSEEQPVQTRSTSKAFTENDSP